ncbi:Fructosamine kinase-domain-containing protein [Xylariales sp. PMI_506]|nr:Fructosamine kinase-domain-containing protein [Xylariales sp. PMI_506]
MEMSPKYGDPLGANVELDEAIIAALPSGCRILSVSQSGTSLWVDTVKISVQLENGDVTDFSKSYRDQGELDAIGANMMKGAFEAELALHNAIPNHVPKPLAWGTNKRDPDTHFYLCAFIEMYDELPLPNKWAATVFALHLNSMGKSPTGQFGFHVTTHLASVPVDNTWNASWEAFWTQQMTSLFEQDERIHGPDEELTRLKASFLTRVIPRYLRPLETEGRTVTPCLIHSDLWPGNIKPMTASNELCLACISSVSPIYWPAIADIGICRNPRYKLGAPVDISDPQEDFNGRNAV